MPFGVWAFCRCTYDLIIMAVPKAIFRMASICGPNGWLPTKFPTLICDVTKLGSVLVWIGEKHPQLLPMLIIQQMPIDCPDDHVWDAYEVAFPLTTPQTLVDYLTERYPDWAADC